MSDIKRQLLNNAKAVNTVVFLFAMEVLDLIAEQMGWNVDYVERKERGLQVKRQTFKSWLSSFPTFMAIIKTDVDHSKHQLFKTTMELLFKEKSNKVVLPKRLFVYMFRLLIMLHLL